LDFLDEKDGADEIDERDEYCLATPSFFNVIIYPEEEDVSPDDLLREKRCFSGARGTVREPFPFLFIL
jgi:hypothetical protein